MAFSDYFNFEDTTKEGRTIVSVIITLVFFFTFVAITGDLWSGIGLAAALEIILFYALSIF